MLALQDAFFEDPPSYVKIIDLIKILEKQVPKKNLYDQILYAISLKYNLASFISCSFNILELPHYDPIFIRYLALAKLIPMDICFEWAPFYLLDEFNHFMRDNNKLIEFLSNSFICDFLRQIPAYSCLDDYYLNIESHYGGTLSQIIVKDDIESFKLYQTAKQFELNSLLEIHDLLYGYFKIPLICFAEQNQSKKIIKYLLINGADPTLTTQGPFSFSIHRNAYDFAAAIGDYEFLRMNSENPPKITKNTLYSAIEFHQNPMIQFIFYNNSI